MKVLETFLVFVIMLEAFTSAQFLEQPNAGILFAPVDYEVTLTCSVEEGYLIDWHVSWSNGNEADASNGIIRQVLINRNFSLEGLVTTKSTLSLWETEDGINNGTNITCLAQKTGAQRAPFTGNVVQVVFYAGDPPSPTNPSVTEDEQGALNISWSLMVIEGVPVNYTLTVLNLNTTSAQPIIIAGLLDQHYVFETSRSCDVHSFTVTAVTAAGNSTPSQEVTFTRNGNSMICSVTTSEILLPQHITASTTISLPTTQTDSSQPITTSSPETQDSSTIILIAAVSIAFAVLMTVLVLVNAMICVFCYKKNKTEVKSDLKDPVYEAPYDVAMLPSLFDRGTPFAMTSSSAYDATGDTQELSFRDSLSFKSSKNDTDVPFAMKSSSAYEISKNSQKLPFEASKNSSFLKSSKNLDNRDSYVPFAMTSSSAYELSKNPRTPDKSLSSTFSTHDKPSKSIESACDTVPFATTSFLAYEVSKNHDSDNKIISTASPSADESSKKLNSEGSTVPFDMTLYSGISKNCKNLDFDDKTISPSADESFTKLDNEGSVAMTPSSAYEVSKNHKNADFDDKIALPAADECSKKLDTKSSTVPTSSASGVSMTPQKHPAKSPDNSTSPSFSTYEPAKSPNTDDDMAG